MRGLSDNEVRLVSAQLVRQTGATMNAASRGSRRKASEKNVDFCALIKSRNICILGRRDSESVHLSSLSYAHITDHSCVSVRAEISSNNVQHMLLLIDRFVVFAQMRV